MKIYTYEGYTLKIGTSARENDELITNAHPDDIWLHLEKFSSPHGILSPAGTDAHAIAWAAGLVKENSARRCRNLKNIGVQYIPVKYVEKTSTPGCVALKKKPRLIKV